MATHLQCRTGRVGNRRDSARRSHRWSFDKSRRRKRAPRRYWASARWCAPMVSVLIGPERDRRSVSQHRRTNARWRLGERALSLSRSLWNDHRRDIHAESRRLATRVVLHCRNQDAAISLTISLWIVRFLSQPEHLLIYSWGIVHLLDHVY
jgi:hypothetical protein